MDKSISGKIFFDFGNWDQVYKASQSDETYLC